MRHFSRRLCSGFAFSAMARERPSTALNGKPTLRGVVFDMDGTLTVPNLDFPEMYRRCNVARSDDILEAVASMPPDRAAKALSIIEEMEEEGRRTLQLAPGAAEVGRWLASHGVPMALVTRNTRKTVDVLMDRLWKPSTERRNGEGATKAPFFHPTLSRDDRPGLPHKPHPASLEIIAAEWGHNLPSDCLLMVGDSPANDVAFGKAAGVSTALIDVGRRYGGGTDGGANVVVNYLFQLPRCLWETFDIDGPLGNRGASPSKRNGPVPTTAAASAAARGDVDALRSMPEQDLVSADETGNPPLVWASDAGSAAAVEVLLGVSGVNVDARGFLGATAACRASRGGHADVLRLLAEAGADLDAANDKMQYPLHFAAFQGHEEAVRVLLELGASTIVLDRKGRTPAEDTRVERIRDMILQARMEALDR